ncbi:competence protein ComEA [Cutibacterium acnes JCM 18918]|nr:competence protein ComEA [Cutibacterium acnes JCM 18918]
MTTTETVLKTSSRGCLPETWARRSATPAEEEPAQEETPPPRRTVSRVHASAVGVLLVVALSVIAVWLMRSKPTEVPAGAVMVSTVPEGTTMPGRETTESEASSESTTPAALPVATTTPAVGAPIQVHVAGRVKHPGVYTVNPTPASLMPLKSRAG